MSESDRFGPIELRRADGEWRFSFADPGEKLLELPPNFEQDLTGRLAELGPAADGTRIVCDLGNAPALSSRHLGVLISLHKAVRAWTRKLRIVGSSPGVRHLFAVTRTGQFFEVD